MNYQKDKIVDLALWAKYISSVVVLGSWAGWIVVAPSCLYGWAGVLYVHDIRVILRSVGCFAWANTASADRAGMLKNGDQCVTSGSLLYRTEK